ncbi:MAG: porin [Polyangiaceae bacterium]|jgi:hypothetical protein|nr:porin [Polyangiaceae bacterium]MBK8940252.1 porin [Polyangiaceae bacterium]
MGSNISWRARPLFGAVAAALVTLSTGAALAQPAPQTPAQPAPSQEDRALSERIDKLEQTLRALEEASRKREAEVAALLKGVGTLQAAEAARGAAEAALAAESKKPSLSLTVNGAVELYYQWSFNDPDNGITNFRGFDNRHNSFTVPNVMLDVRGAYEGAEARVALQVGHAPSTYTLAEPALAGSGAANASSGELWKYVQQAYVGYEAPVGGGLLVQGGIFLSPIGPESLVIKDSWSWSRSNLFFGLPFYHAGLRATYKASPEWSVTLAGYNGWNDIVDNNDEKSLSLQLSHASKELSWSLLYFGGVERPTDAPEGRAWRHTFDTYATWTATSWLALQPHLDGGFEPNEFGASGWVAGALSARFTFTDWLFGVVRQDAFYEVAAEDSTGTAGRIFWPAEWVASSTATLEARAVDHVLLRLEVRHDHAEGDMFFRGAVRGDGVTTPFVPNTSTQDTLTLGATAWF